MSKVWNSDNVPTRKLFGTEFVTPKT